MNIREKIGLALAFGTSKPGLSQLANVGLVDSPMEMASFMQVPARLPKVIVAIQDYKQTRGVWPSLYVLPKQVDSLLSEMLLFSGMSQADRLVAAPNTVWLGHYAGEYADKPDMQEHLKAREDAEGFNDIISAVLDNDSDSGSDDDAGSGDDAGSDDDAGGGGDHDGSNDTGAENGVAVISPEDVSGFLNLLLGND